MCRLSLVLPAGLSRAQMQRCAARMVSSLHYHIPVLCSIIYLQILHGSIHLEYLGNLHYIKTRLTYFGHSRTRKRLSQIPRQELSELPLHYSSISIILKRSLRAGARLPLPRSRAGPASSAVACLAPMRPAGSGAGAGGCNPADPVAGAGGCVEADHVQRLVLLAHADSSTKA